MRLTKRLREATPRQAELLFACALLATGLLALVVGATMVLVWDSIW
jgi:hypothetical protein